MIRAQKLSRTKDSGAGATSDGLLLLVRAPPSCNPNLNPYRFRGWGLGFRA